LYILDLCGNGPCHLNVTVVYDDDSEEVTQIEVLDWWGKKADNRFAAGYFGRVRRFTNAEDGGAQINLLENVIDTNGNKFIVKVKFEMTDANSYHVCAIFGLHDGINQIEIESGMLDDVIAEKSPVKNYTTAGLDYNGFVIPTADCFFGDGEQERQYGIPNDGAITVNYNSENIPFQLGDFAQLNSTRLLTKEKVGNGITNTVTLELATKPVINKLYILGTACNGPANISITYNLTDGTMIESEATATLKDWYNQPIYSTGRYYNSVDQNSACGLHVISDEPSLTEEKSVESITFTNIAETGESKAIIMALTMVGTPTVADGIKNVNAGEDRKAATYSITGQKVGKNFKGLVIKNGKKYIVK